VDSYHIAGYAGLRQGAFGLQGGAVYSWNTLGSTRNVAFPGFAQSVTANYDAGTTQMFGEFNYRFLVDKTWLQAFAAFNYIHHETDAFQETGGAAALSVASNSDNVTFTTLGGRSVAVLGQLNDLTFVGRGTVGWRHAFGDVDPKIVASFVGSLPFNVAGTPIATDAVVGEAALDMNYRANMTFGVAWSGQFGNHADENQVRGQFTYRW
jgi:outer membrane autotransporter protein